MFISTTQFRLLDQSPKEFLKNWQQKKSQIQWGDLVLRDLKLLQALEDENYFQIQVDFLTRSSLYSWHEQFQSNFLKDLTVKIEESSTLSKWEMVDHVTLTKSDYRSAHMDRVIDKNFAKETKEQAQIKKVSLEKGLPPINVAAMDGRILELLVQLNGAKKGVEIGTLGGYSASWLLRGMLSNSSEAQLFSLELEDDRAQLARENLLQCGFSEKNFQIVSGDARQNLESYSSEWKDLDFVFIDADKTSYPEYLQWSLDHLKLGGLILIDNSFLWGGMNYFEIKDLPESLAREWGRFDTPTRTQFSAMQKTWEILRDEPRLKSIQIPTGEGLGLAIKIA